MSLPNLQQFHKKPYPAISPSRPELSQEGRTVVITGGNSGIGYAIARGFITANAKCVIIIGRRPTVADSAVVRLVEEAKQVGSKSTVQGRICDISDLASAAAFWTGLQNDDIHADVLVLNAATSGPAAPILESGLDGVWATFEANVRSTLDFTIRFYQQSVPASQKGMFLVNVSSCAGYMWNTMAPERPSYAMTKNASTLLIQQIAKDTIPDDMQIISFHPGAIATEEVTRRMGSDASMNVPFDDENLAGHFAVWAASMEARFLHGRFVWANWDIEEIKSGDAGKQIAKDANFLKVGIEGLSESMGSPMLSSEQVEAVSAMLQERRRKT